MWRCDWLLGWGWLDWRRWWRCQRGEWVASPWCATADPTHLPLPSTHPLFIKDSDTVLPSSLFVKGNLHTGIYGWILPLWFGFCKRYESQFKIIPIVSIKIMIYGWNWRHDREWLFLWTFWGGTRMIVVPCAASLSPGAYRCPHYDTVASRPQ